MAFNGGNSCFQAYINQHEFFISKAKLLENQVDDIGPYSPGSIPR